MHQAVEAQEGVPIKDEEETLGHDHAAELSALRQAVRADRASATPRPTVPRAPQLRVVPIPTNMPMIRLDESDVVYQTFEGQFQALVDDIVEREASSASRSWSGRPAWSSELVPSC